MFPFVCGKLALVAWLVRGGWMVGWAVRVLALIFLLSSIYTYIPQSLAHYTAHTKELDTFFSSGLALTTLGVTGVGYFGRLVDRLPVTSPSSSTLK